MCQLVTLYSSGHHISRTTEFMSRAVIGGWMLLCLLWRATLALRQPYIFCSMAQPSSLPHNTYTCHTNVHHMVGASVSLSHHHHAPCDQPEDHLPCNIVWMTHPLHPAFKLIFTCSITKLNSFLSISNVHQTPAAIDIYWMERSERLIEPSSSWFPPKFPSG